MKTEIIETIIIIIIQIIIIRKTAVDIRCPDQCVKRILKAWTFPFRIILVRKFDQMMPHAREGSTYIFPAKAGPVQI